MAENTEVDIDVNRSSSADDLDDLDELDDIEFALEDVESKIAPLALAVL
jgi:hypothetical protein